MSSRSDGVFYLTTPIYYINAPPHLGHAYTTIVADAMARYRRARRRRRLLPDRDGRARRQDRPGRRRRPASRPRSLADRNSKALPRRVGRARDHLRRLHPDHRAPARQGGAGDPPGALRQGRDLLRQVRRPVLLRLRALLHGEGDRRRQVPRPPDAARSTSRRRTTSSGCRRTRTGCRRYLEDHPEFVQPDRYRNEVLGFLREPLQDLSISRPKTRLQWGIPLPFDDRYVTYVWFDALLNYVSALGDPGDPRFEQLLAARPST